MTACSLPAALHELAAVAQNTHRRACCGGVDQQQSGLAPRHDYWACCGAYRSVGIFCRVWLSFWQELSSLFGARCVRHAGDGFVLRSCSRGSRCVEYCNDRQQAHNQSARCFEPAFRSLGVSRCRSAA